MTAPILITGMHRSGTTLMAQMLSELGWFGGHQLEANAESKLFLRINNWLLLQCGGSWFYPPDKSVWHDRQAMQFCQSFVEHVLSHHRLCGYLGRWHWQRRDALPAFAFPWGFKDPRATLTLPFWQRLYPDLRVIHVTRHGVDVAQSLLSRRHQRLAERTESLPRRANSYWRKVKQRRIEIGLSTLADGLALWSNYNHQFAEQAIPKKQLIHVQYEQLLKEPAPVLSRIVDQFKLSTSTQDLERAAAMARPDRALAYRKKPELLEFSSRHTDALAEFGYPQ